jgi:hypothetical protein
MTFGKKILNIKNFFDFLCTFFFNLSFWEQFGEIVLQIICLHVKYRYFSQILMNINFVNTFSKKPQTSNFVKIRPGGAELFHADRNTVGRRDKYDVANNRFSQFRERS